MNKAIGLLLLVLGAFLFFKAVWFVMVIVAFALVLGAITGSVGRWAYGMALALLLLAVPLLAFKTLFFGLALVVKLLPLILICVGAYTLLKKVT